MLPPTAHATGYRSACSLITPCLILPLLFLLVALAGCAGHATRTQELMATDYLQLDNDALLLHYYEVEDQITLSEQRRSSPSVSLGFGLGSYGGSSSVGAGVGVSTPIGQPETAADLRAHRNQVRLELQKRGVAP
ncbi:hypothetical protein [Pelovirga terrestris]|uniref:Uncharacterized protein n=1 Tax=Pelovirga terrestris TaxID=2771352 RepID=A0A8J6R5C7_9BACT|nr:hypothetical protein [Pelovirga terrestris]MBD1400134.1 hypothetical protein [Pelovirga terrestris]